MCKAKKELCTIVTPPKRCNSSAVFLSTPGQGRFQVPLSSASILMPRIIYVVSSIPSSSKLAYPAFRQAAFAEVSLSPSRVMACDGLLLIHRPPLRWIALSNEVLAPLCGSFPFGPGGYSLDPVYSFVKVQRGLFPSPLVNGLLANVFKQDQMSFLYFCLIWLKMAFTLWALMPFLLAYSNLPSPINTQHM